LMMNKQLKSDLLGVGPSSFVGTNLLLSLVCLKTIFVMRCPFKFCPVMLTVFAPPSNLSYG
jgi:hypothetical protein